MFGRIQTSQVWFYEVPNFGKLESLNLKLIEHFVLLKNAMSIV